MLILYNKNYIRTEITDISKIKIDLNEISWISIFNPSSDEERSIESLLNIKITNINSKRSRIFQNKLYEENNVLHLNLSLFLKPENSHIHLKHIKMRLIIVKNILISIFEEKIESISSINNFNYHQYSTIEKPFLKMLLVLLENLVNTSAIYLEESNHILDEENHKISNKEEKNNLIYKEIVQKITLIEDSISRTRENFISILRILDFLAHVEKFTEDLNFVSHVKIFFKEISILNEHTTFLSNKSNFLLSIVLGLVNIEQNNIMKIFSLVALVLTPPTLIASIYGMNFDFMPELKWPFGYTYALFMMFVSSWLPYKYFKYKKWF